MNKVGKARLLILAFQLLWLLTLPAFASLPAEVRCLDSRIAGLAYPSGLSVAYARNAMGQVTGVTANGNPIVSGASYLPLGPLASLTYGNGVTEARAFDMSYRATGVTDTGSSALSSLSYTLDAADNVSSIADNVSSANNQSFTYDGLDRLLTATGPYGALSWTLNSVGARQTQTLGANPADTYTDGEVLNKIVSGSLTTTMGYSGSTNLTAITPSTGSASSFTINRANRLATATIPGSAVETYTYDAFGNQFSRNPGTTQASAVEYSYGPGNVLLEESLNGAAQVNYLYLDGRPVSVQYPTSSTHDYIHTDRLGTPVLVTDPNKTKVWSASYRPYGEATITGSIVQNLRLPGQFAGQVSGWYHNGARDYNPAWGQYVELDPLGLFAGPHPFKYANDNPLKFIDPSGLAGLSGAAAEEEEEAIALNAGVGALGPEAIAEAASIAVEEVAAEFGLVAGPGYCEIRTAQLQQSIPDAQKGRVTMAVGIAQDANGQQKVLVGTSEDGGYLRPGVQLNPDEIMAAGYGHAEADIVNFARENGYTLVEVGATRPICADCFFSIQGSGAVPVTPIKQQR